MEKRELYYENEKPILFVMQGLPGSGKSTVAETIVTNRGKAIVHSTDALRKEMFGDANIQDNPEKVFATLHARVISDLKSGKDVVLDATNLGKMRRVHFLRNFNQINCHKVNVCVLTPFSVCMERNAERERVVPEDRMKQMYQTWNPPHLSEGFDNIVLVYDYGDRNNRDTYSLYGLIELFKKIDTMSQRNEHHQLTLGEHCRTASKYIGNSDKYTRQLQFAALLHDIGKVSTGFLGEDGQYHYYNHNCTGAYESMFYLDADGMGMSDEDKLYISNLIYYHMKPITTWQQSQKSMNRDRSLLGNKLFDDVMLIHQADINSRTMEHNINWEDKEIER